MKKKMCAPSIAVIAFVACGGSPATAPVANVPAAAPVPAPPPAPGRAAWSYSGDTGPLEWGDLDPAFATCKTGSAQSPIDLPAAPSSHQAATAAPKWDPVPLQVLNTGHSIQVNDAAPSSFVVDGTQYKLAQFHFHVPSEHTVGGRGHDLEMHLVHKSDAGKVLVVAIFFDAGKDNATLAPVWAAMPAKAGPAVDVPATPIDVASLLPAAPRYLRYTGSLTAPPCTEGVTWMVVEPDAASQVSAEQLRKLREATQPATNRPVQPAAGRQVVELAP